MKLFPLYAFLLLTLAACQTTSAPIQMAQNYLSPSNGKKWCHDKKHQSFDEDAYYANFE